LGPGERIERKTPLEQLAGERFGARWIPLPQSGLGLGQRQLDRGRRELRVLKEILDRAMQPIGDDPETVHRWLGPSELDLVQKRAAEVLTGNGRQGEAK
jgi:hypothetical protein